MASQNIEVQVALLITEFEQSLKQFRNLRLKTLQQLRNLLAKAKQEESIKHHGRNTKIAVVSGSSAAIAGGVLAVVGFGFSFVTGGTSLILSVVGAGIGGAGGVTAAGARGVSYLLNKKHYKEVSEAIDKDREAWKEVLETYNKVLSGIKKDIQTGTSRVLGNQMVQTDNPVRNGFVATVLRRSSGLKKVIQTGTSRDLGMQFDQTDNPVNNGLKATKYLGKDILFEAITTAGTLKGIKSNAAIGRGVVAGADAAVDASGSVFKSLSTAARVFHIGGFAVTVIALPIDIYILVTESIKIHKGTNDVEEKIEGLIEKLKIPEDFVDQCLNEVFRKLF